MILFFYVLNLFQLVRLLNNSNLFTMAHKPLGIRETDRLMDELNLAPILKDRVRQVRFLYHNGNKCTKVYEEKLVRLMIHRLQQQNSELKECIKEILPLVNKSELQLDNIQNLIKDVEK